MRSAARQALRVILLVILCLGMSGIVRTADAFLDAAAPACCAADEQHESEDSHLPCSAADCSCAWCSGAEAGGTLRLAVSLVSPTLYEPASHPLPLSSFFASIDYPPEHC